MLDAGYLILDAGCSAVRCPLREIRHRQVPLVGDTRLPPYAPYAMFLARPEHSRMGHTNHHHEGAKKMQIQLTTYDMRYTTYESSRRRHSLP